MTIALDASMAIAWLFDDERTENAERVLRRVGDAGAWIPSIWRLEVANTLRNCIRRKRCDEQFAEASLAKLGDLPIQSDDLTDQRAWTSTLALSRQHDLTPYDAAYLELAIRRQIPLATCDKALRRAAEQSGLAVLAG